MERDYLIKYQVPCGGFSLRKKCKHSDSLSCLKVWNLLLKNNLSDNDANLLLNSKYHQLKDMTEINYCVRSLKLEMSMEFTSF